MKIKLLEDITIDVEEYPSIGTVPDDKIFEREPVILTENYTKGHVFYGEAIDDFGTYVNFEFEDGSRTYTFYKDKYEVIA